MTCFFASDPHGQVNRYRKLINRIEKEWPEAVFLGGDLLPRGFGLDSPYDDFVEEFLAPEFSELKVRLGENYPALFLILGNDDPRIEVAKLLEHEQSGIWMYCHQKLRSFDAYTVIGYNCVPPTPFLLKDWERYDVSRYVDPGCISPEQGFRSIEMPENEKKYRTIQTDLENLSEGHAPDKMICLFHSPPHRTNLDRADLKGKTIDHVPLDPNIGSIAIRRFIETKQPLLSLHGHVHESTRLTGNWQDRIGHTYMFNAAHDGKELALIRFDPENPRAAQRELI